jgi:Pentatricopeptide repeat domain
VLATSPAQSTNAEPSNSTTQSNATQSKLKTTRSKSQTESERKAYYALLKDAIRHGNVALRDSVLLEKRFPLDYPTHILVANDMLTRRDAAGLTAFLRQANKAISAALCQEMLACAVKNPQAIACAEGVLSVMKELGHVPSAFSCNDLLRHSIRNSSRESAMSLLARMKEWKVANAVSYEIMANVDTAGVVEELLRDMRAYGLKPTTACNDKYIRALSGTDDTAGCERVLAEMKEYGPPPGILTYTYLMQVCRNDYRRCRELFDEALARGIQPTKVTMTLLLDAARSDRDAVANIAALIPKTAFPSAHGLNVLLNHAAEREDWSACAKLFDEATRTKTAINTTTLQIVLGAIMKHGDKYPALLVAHGRVADVSSFKRVFLTKGTELVRYLATTTHQP